MTKSPAAITVAILAMGGEGGGVLADWLVDMAENAGCFAQKTSVPGVAQRTGSTIYYCEIFPEEAARAAGNREPVLALMPVPGELDVVIASELMECGRAVQRGLVTPERTTLIASTHRVYSMSERTHIGDGRVDATQFIDAGKAAARIFVRQDFFRLAQESGSVISAPLFGALAATGALPFSRTQYEEAIRRSGVGVEASLAAFATGFAAAQRLEDASSGARSASGDAAAPRVGIRMRAIAKRVEETFPEPSHAILLAGVLRLGDYQDE
ncbi:MAG TPA: indolepyruvate oxidoreductase subunit beta family protein, partial [Gemmatimonadaceae bacterium]|nr:indolepyruvate oxidoreductase subunit beta family protein [Gemmatimonadaceae bacterium]